MEVKAISAVLHYLAVTAFVLGVMACVKQTADDAPVGTAAAGKRFEWTIQSLWQAGSINHRVFEQFCERVKTLSGGRLTLTSVPVGTLVAYNETLDAVSSGVLDGHQSGPGYLAGKDPGFAMLSEFPGGYETAYQMQMWFEYGGGKELARELFGRFNVYYVGSVWHGMESIPSKKPLMSVDDLKGVKMRIPEGLNQEIFKYIGAAPVNIPGSEVYTSLDRGVIDATDWGTLGMNVDLGYHKIAPYQIYPGFHSLPMGDLAVNMDRWNELPARWGAAPVLGWDVETSQRKVSAWAENRGGNQAGYMNEYLFIYYRELNAPSLHDQVISFCASDIPSPELPFERVGAQDQNQI